MLAFGCDPNRGMSFEQIGEQVYQQQCAICHQAEGGGVPDLQPALAGSEIVLGDPAPLIEVILEGSRASALADQAGYANAMAGFAQLSDLKVAAVATHMRTSFGNSAAPISEQEVAAERDR